MWERNRGYSPRVRRLGIETLESREMFAAPTTLQLAAPLRTAAVAAASAPTSLYGTPWNADGLANLEVGKQVGRAVDYRIQATHTGAVDSARIYLAFSSPGYYRGNGGQVQLQIFADDGTAAHRPTGSALATSLITNPMADGFNRLFVFDRAAQLTGGNLYHLVFTNPAPDPVDNYVSVDQLYNASYTPNVQPAVSDTNLATLVKYSSSDPWTINYGHTPVLSLYYQDGTTQGQAYINAATQSGLRNISGTNSVAETFTVSGDTRTASDVNIRLKKTGKPGSLQVRLETASGTLVEQGTISASAVQTGYSWIKYTWPTPVTLQSGTNYRLVVSAPAGDSYQIYPLQEGTAYGFNSPSLFHDGYFQYNTGSGWSDPSGNRTDFDMQMYFETD